MKFRVAFNPSCGKILNYGGYTCYPKAMSLLPEGTANSDKLQASVRRADVVLGDWVDEQSSWYVGRYLGLDKCKSIMISRDYALGDILFVTALIKNIKIAYPKLKIYFKTVDKSFPLLCNNPDCDVVTRQDDVDAVLRTVDLHIPLNDVMEKYEDASKPVLKNRIEILSEYVGVPYIQKTPCIYLSDSDIDSWKHFVNHHQRPFIALCPSSLRKEKALSPEQWQSVVNGIDFGTIFIIDKHDIGIKGKNVAYAIDNMLEGTIALMTYMDYAVTLDSFWSHVCSGLNVSQTLITSCTDGKLLSKDYPNVDVIEPDVTCYPCWYNLRLGNCSLNHYPNCVSETTIKRIIDSVKENINVK